VPAGLPQPVGFFCLSTDRGILIGIVISRSNVPKSAMLSAIFITIF
jgi:hypothetical protein